MPLPLPRSMSYQDMFRRLYPTIDPRHIHALVLHEYQTLDHLGPETIIAEARLAVVLLQVAPRYLVERLAANYRL